MHSIFLTSICIFSFAIILTFQIAIIFFLYNRINFAKLIMCNVVVFNTNLIHTFLGTLILNFVYTGKYFILAQFVPLSWYVSKWDVNWAIDIYNGKEIYFVVVASSFQVLTLDHYSYSFIGKDPFFCFRAI